MKLLATPRPRFRLYTSLRTYATVVREVAARRTTAGDDLGRFEAAVRDRTGARHALCMPQARVGIYLALRELVAPGQKVICSPFTIYEVINMVLCAGGRPVFADIDRASCNVSADRIEELIDDDTGAVLVTHLHGLAADVEAIAETCRRRGVPLVEDAAQAFGTRVGGRSLGTFGAAGIFSFGMYKNLNTLYGGMLVTDDAALRERIAARMADWPYQELRVFLARAALALATDVSTWPPLFRAFTYQVFRVGLLWDVELLNRQLRVEADAHRKQEIPEGYLRRMRPLQARLGLRQLGRIDDDSRERLRFARMYHDGLADLQELLCPPLREDLSHIYTYYPIQCESRDALVRHAVTEGCDFAILHMHNLADAECFAEFHRDCPEARATAARVVLLPTYPRYGERDVQRNVRAIRAFFGRA